MAAGIHLLIADLFPPGRRDPASVHRLVWDDHEDDSTLLADKQLTLAAYIGGEMPEAFVEPTAVGDALAEMPLFLTPEVYVPVSMEATYQSAWREFPTVWPEVLDRPN